MSQWFNNNNNKNQRKHCSFNHPDTLSKKWRFCKNDFLILERILIIFSWHMIVLSYYNIVFNFTEEVWIGRSFQNLAPLHQNRRCKKVCFIFFYIYYFLTCSFGNQLPGKNIFRTISTKIFLSQRYCLSWKWKFCFWIFVQK